MLLAIRGWGSKKASRVLSGCKVVFAFKSTYCYLTYYLLKCRKSICFECGCTCANHTRGDQSLFSSFTTSGLSGSNSVLRSWLQAPSPTDSLCRPVIGVFTFDAMQEATLLADIIFSIFNFTLQFFSKIKGLWVFWPFLRTEEFYKGEEHQPASPEPKSFFAPFLLHLNAS